MARCFAKTDAGQREIRERSRALSRSARTLLVLADGTRPDADLLAMVRGATAADLQSLLDAGLLAETSPAARPAAAARPARGAAPAAPPDKAPDSVPDTVPEAPGAEAVSTLDYAQLYAALTAMAREQLGLIKGYKVTLEVERAMNLEGLREVAARFVVEVDKAKGPVAGQMVRRALGMAR